MKNARIEIEHVMKSMDIVKILLTLALGISGSAVASSYEVRTDLLGRRQVYLNDSLVVTAAEKQGGTFYYDAERNEIGHALILADGCTVYFDALGELQGTSCANSQGRPEYRDADGRELETGEEKTVMFFEEIIGSGGMNASSGESSSGAIRGGNRRLF